MTEHGSISPGTEGSFLLGSQCPERFPAEQYVHVDIFCEIGIVKSCNKTNSTSANLKLLFSYLGL